MYLNFLPWVAVFSAVLRPANSTHPGFPRHLALISLVQRASRLCLDFSFLYYGLESGLLPCFLFLDFHFMIPSALSVVVSNILSDFCLFSLQAAVYHYSIFTRVEDTMIDLQYVFKMCTTLILSHLFLYLWD